MLAQLFSPINKVLSSNWRWDIITPLSYTLTLNPKNRSSTTMAFIITFRPSATIKRRKGESGSPWQSPHWKENYVVRLPSTRIEVIAALIHYFIHFLHNVGKLILDKNNIQIILIHWVKSLLKINFKNN